MNSGILEVDMAFEDLNDKCAKTITGFKTELQSIKAGRANPHILDKISVDYYGAPTPINQMANISVTEARILTISVWDQSAIKNVERAILSANIGITPNCDGKVIRLVFPKLTEEKRKQLVKEIKALSENMKVTMRSHRRDANDELKKCKKDKIVTDDEIKEFEKEVDKVTNSNIDIIEDMFKVKEKEILNV